MTDSRDLKWYLEVNQCREEDIIDFYTTLNKSIPGENLTRISYLSCSYFKALLSLMARIERKELTPYTFQLASHLINYKEQLKHEFITYPTTYLRNASPVNYALFYGVLEAYRFYTEQYKQFLINLGLDKESVFNFLFDSDNTETPIRVIMPKTELETNSSSSNKPDPKSDKDSDVKPVVFIDRFFKVE